MSSRVPTRAHASFTIFFLLNAGSVSEAFSHPGLAGGNEEKGARGDTRFHPTQPATRPHAPRRNHLRAYNPRALYKPSRAHIRYAWWVGRAESSTAATLVRGSGSVRITVRRIRGMRSAGFCLRPPRSRPLPALIHMESNTPLADSGGVAGVTRAAANACTRHDDEGTPPSAAP